jgi:GTP pyrophosphokinase
MGNLQARGVVEAVYPGLKRKRSFYEKVMPIARARPRVKREGNLALPIHGLVPGMAVHYAACCHPLPGDRIVGLVTTGKGVTIHTIDCENLNLYAEQPERWIDVSWNTEDEMHQLYVGRVLVILLNEPGSLSALTSIIAKNDANITNIRIVTRSAEFFDILVDVEVKNAQHLTDVLAAMRATPAIHSAERARR